MSTESARDLQLERELFVRALMPSIRGGGAARLAAMLEPLEMPADTYLFRTGEPPEQFFFVVDGHVSMEVEGQAPWTFGPRSLVGMTDMTMGRPHRRSARTTRPTQLLVGRSKQWMDLLDDDPLMAESAINSFSRMMHEIWKTHGRLLPDQPIAFAEHLSLPLPLYQKTLVLRDTPLFTRAGTQAIASLAQVARELSISEGSYVFQEGDAGPTLYVVVSGVIELCFARDREVRVGPFGVLSAAAALSGQLGQYSARAASPSVLLEIQNEDYYDQAEEHPELTRAAMSYMASERERLMDLVPPTA